MEMRGALNRFGFALCVGAAAMCLVLHVATFLTIISLVWITPPFFLVLSCRGRCALFQGSRIQAPLSPISPSQRQGRTSRLGASRLCHLDLRLFLQDDWWSIEC